MFLIEQLGLMEKPESHDRYAKGVSWIIKVQREYKRLARKLQRIEEMKQKGEGGAQFRPQLLPNTHTPKVVENISPMKLPGSQSSTEPNL
jgi:hypothetical protein